MDVYSQIPKTQRRQVVRWLQAARRRITPQHRWTTGVSSAFTSGHRSPVAWCAVGSLTETLQRQHHDITSGLGYKIKRMLDVTAIDQFGHHSVVSLNDSHDVSPKQAHARVLKVYDVTIERLKALS